MYRVQLTDAQRDELNQRTREPQIKPRTRDRLEMVRLSDAGWSSPRIAVHLRLNAQTVRQWLQAFQRGGFDALPDQPHPGQQSALTPAMAAAIRTELRKDEQTWTARQLAAWVAQQFDVHLSPAQLGRRLRRAGIVYQRSSRSVKHKQDPAAVAAKRHELTVHEKRGTKARSTSPTWTKPASL
jgi:putative transposase